jgi:hypothetical protein
VTEWMPATEAEAAMRDALRAGDQELYFRILARTELLLPVSADALAGRAPMGWGTWTTNGRTHVLAFTSAEALQACLAENAGSARRMAYHKLAGGWPNLEWWLAVNPGLPIEGYLPAWFVTQLARGDVRLPGRSSGARSHPDHPEPIGRARATAAVPRRTVPTQTGSQPAAVDDIARPASTDVNGLSRAAPSPAVAGSSGRVEAARVSGAPEPRGSGGAGVAGSGGAGVAGSGGAGVAGSGGAGVAGLAGVRAAGSAGMPSPAPPSTQAEPPGSASSTGASPLPAPRGAAAASIGPTGGRLPTERRFTAAEAAPGGAAPGGAAPGGAGPGGNGSAGFVVGEPAAAPEVTVTPTAPAASLASRPNGVSALDRARFTPANDVEDSLLAAAGGGSTDSFLSTLLLAKVFLPRPAGARAELRPGDDGFGWHTETIDGEPYVVVFTSRARLAEHVGASAEPTAPRDAVPVRFVRLIRAWPDESWSFAVNPGTPVGATLPGTQIVALATWAAEVGLGDDADDDPLEDEPVEAAPPAPEATPAATPKRPTMMQKAVAPTQVGYYLDRGYDRVSGFVHRADEVAHLRTPGKLYAALGLGYPNSPFAPDAAEVYVLRWPAYRPSLYRIPYGGQTEVAMRAMEGWVIERPPFRGNGFAPGDSSDVIAEFKVDSVRLPHGAQLWRTTADGDEALVALLDADGPIWRRVDESHA